MACATREPRTEQGPDPNSTVLVRWVLSQVTPASCTPSHSPLLPSQLMVAMPRWSPVLSQWPEASSHPRWVGTLHFSTPHAGRQ